MLKLVNLKVSLEVMILVDAQFVDGSTHGFTHFALLCLIPHSLQMDLFKFTLLSLVHTY